MSIIEQITALSGHNSFLIISQRKNYPNQQMGWRKLLLLIQEIIPELLG